MIMACRSWPPAGTSASCSTSTRPRCGTGSRPTSAPRIRPAGARRRRPTMRPNCGCCVRRTPSCGGRTRHPTLRSCQAVRQAAPPRRRSPSRAGDEVLTRLIVPAGTSATSDPDHVDGAEDHKDARSIGRCERCSPEPFPGATHAVVDPTVRPAAGCVADHENGSVADPDPTLTAISREISRLGQRPLRRRRRPNRPAAVAGSDTDADGDQVRIGGVAIDPRIGGRKP